MLLYENIVLLVSGLCLFWLAVLGASLGSFVDCAASRWAFGQDPFAGRSHCAVCGHTLGVRDLIPLLSYLFHRGRCRFCGERIPVDCVVAETAGAVCFVALGLCFGFQLELAQWLVFAVLLLCISFADWHKRIIPDWTLVALSVNRIIWVLVLDRELRRFMLDTLAAWSVPAALLVLVLLAEWVVGRDVMGGGDLKLLFVLALYLSWAQLLLTLLTGCLIGLVWAAATGGGRKDALAFGPFLAVGTMVTVCLGGPLLEWYFRLF